jgi:hypothetical protein
MRFDETHKTERSALRRSQSGFMPQHLKSEDERMDVLARGAFLEGLLGSKRITTKTNLYRLIEAIQEEEGSPEDDAFVVSVVSHLLSTGRIRVPISSKPGEDYSHARILGT